MTGPLQTDSPGIDSFRLDGKVAVVTGGNGGLGLGIAVGLGRCGAALLISGRNAEKNHEALRELAAAGIKASATIADVTLEEDCRALVEESIRVYGRIDILVNNAGMNLRRQPQEYSPVEWHRILDTNLTSVFLCSQAAYPEMKKSGGGKIINIGSMMSIFGASFVAAYAASKGGMVQLTKSLATAWAVDNIQVNAILPGWIDSELTRGARKAMPDLNERVLARTPARRWGNPNDLAGAAVFLASAASQFVTGTAIPVDGGFSVQG